MSRNAKAAYGVYVSSGQIVCPAASVDYIICVQDKETINPERFTEPPDISGEGRIVALDLGTKWIGVAVSDETQTIATPVRTIERRSWKKTLAVVKDILAQFDAVGLIIGLPLNTDGTESEMSSEARRIARNFSLSLDVPVALQDERLTSYEARGRLWQRGVELKDTKRLVDGEAAGIILSDFLTASDRTG